MWTNIRNVLNSDIWKHTNNLFWFDSVKVFQLRPPSSDSWLHNRGGSEHKLLWGQSDHTHVFCSDSAQVASAGWHRRSPQDQSQLWFMRFYSCTQTNGSQLWTQKTLMMLQHLSVCRTERLFAAPSAPPSAPPIVRDEWMFVQQVEEQVVLLQTTWLPNSWAQFTEARESSAPFSNF